MKYWIRNNRDYVLAEMSGDVTCDSFGLLTRAVFDAMTPTSIHGWFVDSGYTV